MIDWTGLLLGAVGLALGGVLKGATGAGAPILAVPLLAMLYDVRLAVAIFTLPNLFSNVWQGWRYRDHVPSRPLARRFALGGMAGAAIGSFILVSLSTDLLLLIVAVAVLGYVVFRLLRPDWSLGIVPATRLALPTGFAGGLLQGAVGLSAPVSITFLNAIRLERAAFIATISIFFAAMALVQIPLLLEWGVLTPQRLLLSAAAIVPLLAAMPVGGYLARRISKATFDWLVLALLTLIALRMAAGAIF